MAYPDIFAYLDYRAYLRDACAAKKAGNAKYSLRYLATRLGRDSGFLARVLQGQRRLSPADGLRFAAILGLKPKESAFLEELMLYAHSRAHDEGKRHLERLLGHTAVASKLRRLRSGQIEFFGKWYYSALRELLHFHRFDGDFRALGRKLRPAITASEAKKAVELLLDMGLLKRKAGSRLEVTERFIQAPEDIAPILVHSFQLAMMDLAKESIDRFPKAGRDVSTLTLSLSAEGFAQTRERIREFRKALVDIADADQGVHGVYQVNVQLFPLTDTEENHEA